jgi:hypothetical protein
MTKTWEVRDDTLKQLEQAEQKLEKARELIRIQTRVGIQQRERIEVLEEREKQAAELLRRGEAPCDEDGNYQWGWRTDRDQWLEKYGSKK